MNFRMTAAVSSSLLALAAATPALAQANPGAPAEASSQGGDIVVTANRETSLLSKTPIAMTAVTGEGLRSAGVTNPTQLADTVPNLSIDRNNGLQITIRGVTSTDNTEKGDPSASFLLDGVYLARAQAQEVSFFDLERVEVLRGPQGTLFGRNTTAGLVNLISAKPTHEFGASLDASYGSFNATQVTGMINVPAGEHLALRAAVNYDRRDSYLKQGASPYSLSPFKDNLSGRLSAKIDLSDRLVINLEGDYAKIKGDPTNTVLLSNFYQAPFTNPAAGTAGINPLYIAGSASADALQTLGYKETKVGTRNNSSWGVKGDFAYHLSDSLTLNYLGSYRKFTRDEAYYGYTGSVFANGAIVANIGSQQTFTGDYAQNSHELRLAYASPKLKAQIGAYYFHEDYTIAFLLTGSQSATPLDRGYIFGFPQAGRSKSLAFFGQATYSLTDSLRITAGLRNTNDDKSRVGAIIYHGALGDPLDYTKGVQPGETNVKGFADSLNNASVSYNKTTWRAGLEYDLNNRTLLYGTVSTGYKAGGFNDGCLAGSSPNCTSNRTPDYLFYAPETITSYEAGFKTRFAGNAVHLTGDYFHYDYKNLQLSSVTNACGGPCQHTSNAGAAKVDGVELETTITPDHNNRFDLSFAWLNARYSDYLIVPGVQLAGLKLDRSPNVVVSAGYTLTIPVGSGGIDLGVHTRLSSKYYMLSAPLRAQFVQPSFTKTDLTVTYNSEGKRWYLQGFAKNLENRITVSSIGLSAAFPGLNNGTAQLSDPRTFGVRAGFKF